MSAAAAAAAAVALKRFKLGGKFLESHREIFKHYKEPPFVSSLNSDEGQNIKVCLLALKIQQCRYSKAQR